MTRLQKLFERITSNIMVDHETGCHLWLGQTDGKADPYGRITVSGVTVGVHLASWKSQKGAIKKGYQIDHKCKRRLCVNIDHLQMVTATKNARLREKRKNMTCVFQCLAA